MEPYRQIHDFHLKNNGPISIQFLSQNIETFYKATDYIWRLPYGRNHDRTDYLSVINEGKGTCSTKHALLTGLCMEQEQLVELRCGIYEMNNDNTPGVGAVLQNSGLSFIPEAHCYLFFNDQRIDVTTFKETPEPFTLTIKEELIIQPNDIGEVKTAFHKNYIKKWIQTEEIPYSFEEVWKIRENCIKALSGDEIGCS